MNAVGGCKLPFGNLPRLLMAWLSTEAVRTQSREIVLGRSLSEFMRSLGINSDSGGARGEQTRLRNQMNRLFGCTVSLIYEDESGFARVTSPVADKHEFWWNERKPGERVLWDSKIRLGEDFFNEIIRRPVPLDLNTLTALKRSSLGLDLYLWTGGLSHLHPSRSATALLAAGLSAVRSGPGQGQRQPYRSEFSPRLPTRVEKDQTGLAGVELYDASGRLDPLSLDGDYRPAQSRPARKLGSPFPRQGSPLTASVGRPLGFFPPLHFSNLREREKVKRLFPQVCVIRLGFPRPWCSPDFVDTVKSHAALCRAARSNSAGLR